MYQKLSKILILPILVVLCVGVTSAQEAEVEDFRFFLSYIPNIQFSPIYVAQAKGYFVEEGYNPVVEYGDEPIAVEQIAVGEIPFGIISGEQIILARSNGRPVVFVYEWFESFPIAIVIPSTTEGTTMPELAGKKIGIPGLFGSSYSGLVALLKANDMVESDVQIESIGFNSPDVVCAGAVDAAVVYVNNEPLQIQNRADAGECGDITGVTVLPVSESLNLVSNGVATSEDMIANNPEMVWAINRAFDRGLRDSINNPAETYLLSVDYVENLPISDELRAALEAASAAQIEFLATEPDREAIAESRVALLESLQAEFSSEELIQFEVLLATIELWDADELGWTDVTDWEQTQAILMQIGALSEEVDLTLAATNEFLPTEE